MYMSQAVLGDFISTVHVSVSCRWFGYGRMHVLKSVIPLHGVMHSLNHLCDCHVETMMEIYE